MGDFVTYKQAVKLKELGFDWHDQYNQMYYATQNYCEGNNQFFFDTIGPGDLISSPKMKEDENDGWIEDEDYCVLAPTLAQAQKWLREKGIYLFVTMEESHYYWYIGKEFQIGNCDTYEQALSFGIDRALELLKTQ